MALFTPLNPTITDWHGQRVWLVGASTGIGAALARKLAAGGARVALSARGLDRLDALAAQCEGAVVAAMDVTRRGEIERVRDRLLAQWGGLDLVILNAGTYQPLRAWELTPERIRKTLNINLLGVMDGVAAVVPGMLERGQGAIAIVASVAGYGGLPNATTYGPSKAALINFAETLYMDLAPRGLGVHLISPGFVATPLTAQNDFHMPALITAEQAADEIMAGFARGEFETHFPKRFTRFLKLLQCLPRRLYFPLIRRATGL
ncbi:short-chain dehydrogenase [Parazoarcus communis]|uniref:Short-chain dehydrogenase n=1 Tax=Parazoarcus communis TaxID=41977 RepID=A0A2U8GZA6_9RHOO|nr:SDR family NAD(P)-dependent oxidoreductase [Parazoarcus communis]AWI78650.1 short-chain dehydrogenase [Parazoarcus communis]